ncbi:MAG: SUMF1/EgtB/PvdO family nonheme iron enzyme, partial [Limnobacter sp.]|nr:SUMF1/EgtB/PvdO family nonheme iron enzyme [Limnobacter sp.]
PTTNTVPAGTHTFNLSAPGYEPLQEEVELLASGGREQTLRFSLKPVARAPVPQPARVEPAPPKEQPEPRTVPLAQELGFKFVRIKPSSFTMGSPANQPGRYRNEFEYTVRFTKTVLVARHEVTQAQYNAFKPSVPVSNLPVTNVSWNDAALYANWLSEQDGLDPFYRQVSGRVTGFDRDSKGYRLISEAEWEWLAKQADRAAATVYVWGNQDRIPSAYGNYGAIAGHNDNHAGVAPVGSYGAERAGLFDLSGNVSEWVHDVHEFAAPSRNTTDYLGPSTGSNHVIKGGHYETSRLANLRAAYREYGSGGKPTVGFRLARYE